MNKRNYDREMEQALADFHPGEPLLLHACCAPCSSAVLERLTGRFRITLLFCNPNIWPRREFDLRREEACRLAETVKARYPVAFVPLDWDHEAFRKAVQGLEEEPEGGARCRVCFRLRLEAAAWEAAARGIGLFTTTLTISPHKNAPLLNELGEEAAARHGLRFLPSDFKKRDGYKRSIVLSKEYGLYRQEYCGCEFSRGAQAEAGAGAQE